MLQEKITPDGKASVLLTPLVQSIQGFADTTRQRNEWIEQLRAMPPGSDAEKAALIFGSPLAPGRVDDRYPNFIQALKAQTDDCIGFSILITQSLQSYGERLAARYGAGAPKISNPQFDIAGDLLPDMTYYAAWMKN